MTVPPLGPHAGQRALHTCTSWYAYAAMFGSSIKIYGQTLAQCSWLGRVMSATTSGFYTTYIGNPHPNLLTLALWLALRQPGLVVKVEAGKRQWGGSVLEGVCIQS